MNALSMLRKRSNAFVRDIDVYKELAVEDSAKELVELNRRQMMKSKTAIDTIIKPPYSLKYAKFKGFPNPNLFLTGQFQKEMVLQTNVREFMISSENRVMPFLRSRYGDNIFGIANSMNTEAQAITAVKLGLWYKKKVA